VVRADVMVARVVSRGLPNGFGAQRFGSRGDNAEIGRLILLGKAEEAIAAIAGRPLPGDDERTARARVLVRKGDLENAARRFGKRSGAERHLLLALLATGDAAHAVRTLPEREGSIYLSAWQSEVFNRCLAERGPAFDQLWAGDLAMKHENGAVFEVTDAARELPRARAFEVSPTGPLFGIRMVRPGGKEADLESSELAKEGIDEGWTHALVAKGALPGARRAYRVPVTDARVTGDGDAVLLEFSLPKGSFATRLLDELGVGAAEPGTIDSD
jgi:tRNA pseudouridine13 synthase